MRREEKDDDRLVDAGFSQRPDHRVGDAGAHPADEADDRGDKVHIGKGRLDDAEGADKGGDDPRPLDRRDLLLQDEVGGDDREEGGHFVQHRGVG